MPPLSNSPTSPTVGSIQTPSSTYSTRIGQAHHRSASENHGSGGAGSSPTSPLAYFLGAATSPIRSTSGTGFPFNATKVSGTAIDEDEESPPGGNSIGLFGVGAHTRRGSWAQNGAFGSATIAGSGAGGVAANDRGTSVLRRLSLSGAFQRPSLNSPTAPSAPPPSAIGPRNAVPTLSEPRPGRPSRSATLQVPAENKKRGISPMGERLLKGHFDGF
ncbi:hypothetical protein FRB99_007935 [Tulasnella sp. 403]|nr:hypothetical protein FRB99_007935 [Tulasnella sp. 403]